MHNFSYLLTLLPLLGFVVTGLIYLIRKDNALSNSMEKIIGGFSSLTIFLPFVLTLVLINGLSEAPAPPQLLKLYTWIAAGSLDLSITYRLDSLSLLMSLVVTGVGFLIHLYSMGYMHKDPGFVRFFSYLNLFIFSMMNLILAENMVLMFLGWEGVGLCSYLLIGFWYEKSFDGVKISSTGEAANKAFIVNRIGDFAMLVAMFWIFKQIDSLSFSSILQNTQSFDPQAIFWITLLIFIGCTGKSAQIPLFVWLPDAMAGPTPVSALIHAATMVTSGIYLIARLSPLFLIAPDTMMIIAYVGVLTAFFAATIGLVQNDIKKVLAYSTVSQLGYMFLALGIGAFSTAIFHVVTHAFFKACLFLGSGSVIHAMHEEQDIRKMGGLFKVMPSTAITFLLSSLALAGFPLFSGFFSKDAILSFTFGAHQPVLYALGLLTALLTAFYSMRLFSLTFLGLPRWSEGKHPHESPAIMTLPLWILAILSFVGGLIGLPATIQEHNIIDTWLSASVSLPDFHLSHSVEWVLIGISSVVAISGVSAGLWIYNKQPALITTLHKRFLLLYKILINKYFVDELYHQLITTPVRQFSKHVCLWVDTTIIDGIIHTIGKATIVIGSQLRELQQGLIQNYAFVMTMGILAILSFLLIKIIV